MVNLDIQNGVVQFAPPAVVAGEAVARIAGLSINEWFYIVAILCMVISTLTTSIVAILKTKKKDKDKEDE
ncbi:putative lysis protein [Ralstonia phage 10RS306A]|uniref:Holin n=2 Tax=Serkorvirus TaxID=2731975 RepID=A0AAF0AHC9_9CAUD|nr:putative lysis protein [Ralstonia phage 10RS306A]UYE93687.1 putative lysis protein [Ralstonia phage 10RS305A]WAX26273.1 hypothetical protein [Ralstonia phage p2106]